MVSSVVVELHKAAYLFQIAKLCEWPDESSLDVLRIGVVGKNPFGQTIEIILKGQKIRGRGLTLIRFEKVEDITDCEILFICKSEEKRVSEIVAKVKGRSPLLISDIEGFIEGEGMIGFVEVEDQV